MDTKTFYKHKQFYKHDEKTCIMVDNDINLPAAAANAPATVQQPYKCSECSVPIADAKAFFKHKQTHEDKTCIMIENGTDGSAAPRRKTLIATRLKQHQQSQLLKNELENGCQIDSSSSTDNNEIQFVHERDSFKCALCYGDDDYAPSTSVSTLNKQPTHSPMGASNFSFDKEQVLKHVLIVHLSFLAYKCDTCTQFYAFDEPQTKQHAALVHQCGTGTLNMSTTNSGDASSTQQSQTCHFKLIKTEEEINLAINKAQQFINKLPASTAKVQQTSKTTAKSNLALTNVTIDAQPKYKCCRCVQTPAATTAATTFQPIVLYTYQDALDHVMQVHMSTTQTKKDKKLNYELELFEQNLEDLLASETGQTTTITVGSTSRNTAADQAADCDDTMISDNDLDNGDFCYDDHFTEDLTEWHVILNEPFNSQNILANTLNNSTNQLQSPNSLAANRKQKRFKTNNSTAISVAGASQASLSDTENNSSSVQKTVQKITPAPQCYPSNKRFYFKPHLIYKCQLCSRKMDQFDYNHWLQHDLENHFNLYKHGKSLGQQFSCFKCQSVSQSKTFTNFTQFLEHYKQEHLVSSSSSSQTTVATVDGNQDDLKLINCLVCGAELKCTYVDMLKHFQSEHELNLFDLKLNQTDLELIHTLHIHNQVQLSQSVKLKSRCFIKIPPSLVNANVAEATPLTKIDLINKELKLLNEIYKEQIIEKQIVSWLNSEQFLRRNFNYNS